MNKEGLFVFYGTLRQGMENHNLYGNGMRFIEAIRLKGYKLYSLGEYPYAVVSSGGEHIVAELFHVPDRQVATAIHNMEIEAGYDYHEIAWNGKKYGIYLFPAAGVQDLEISSGDWAEFVALK